MALQEIHSKTCEKLNNLVDVALEVALEREVIIHI